MAVCTVVGKEVIWPPFFMSENGEKMGMGLLLGLQIGVTFSEIRGYTFGVFGGRIEGEGKG